MGDIVSLVAERNGVVAVCLTRQSWDAGCARATAPPRPPR